DRQLVVVLVEVRGQVGGGRVGVVATDGVQDVDPVGLELLGSDLQRVLALLDEAALDAVCRVRELHAAVADRRTTELVEDAGLGATFGVDDDLRPRQQAVVAVLVGDDLDVGGDLGVSLDQAADGGGQAGGEPARGQQGNAAYRHHINLSSSP